MVAVSLDVFNGVVKCESYCVSFLSRLLVYLL